MQKKIAKVSYITCVLPRSLGGVGLLDIEKISNKLAAKWIARSLTNNDFWSVLISRKLKEFPTSFNRSWKGFPKQQILLSKARFLPQGTRLAKGLWDVWFSFKEMLQVKQGARFCIVTSKLSSILWPRFGLSNECRVNISLSI